MVKKCKSEVLAAVHETARGMTEASVMTKRTMKAFDEMCLTPVTEMASEETHTLRTRKNTRRPGNSG